VPVPIVGLIATLGVPGLVTAGGALTLGGNLLAGAIGFGISFAANALFGEKPSVPPAEMKGIFRQSVTVRRKDYGEGPTGGSMLFFEIRDGFLHEVQYRGEGPIDGFTEWYMDERAITIDADGWVATGPLAGVFRIEYRRGLSTETAYESVIDVFPEIYNEDFRGDGCVTIHLAARKVGDRDFGRVYPNRLPQLTPIARRGLVYDPRTETIAYSANLPLIGRAYLTDIDGLGIDPAYIDEDDFAFGADVGDEIILTSGGGSVRRYHGLLSYKLDEEPIGVIERWLIATDGRLFLRPTGKIGYLPGVWIEPTVSIPDGVILSYDLRDTSGPLREATEVTVKYTNRLARYTEATCDPWIEDTDGRPMVIPITAYEINEHHHARRVAKLKSRRSNARWQGTIVTDLYGMKAWDQRFIYVQVSDLDIEFEAFEIEDIQEDEDNMAVVMKVRSAAAEMYEMPFAEEGTPPTVPQDLDEETVFAPQNLVAAGGQRAVSGGDTVAVITATWDAYVDRDDLRAQAQISVSDADSWSDINVADSQTKAEAIGLADKSLYDVRVRWLETDQTPSNWTLFENISAVANPTAPVALSSFTQIAAAPHLGNAVFSLTTPNDSHIKTVKLYRKATGVPLNVAVDTPIAAPLNVSASATYGYTDGDTTRADLVANGGFSSDTVWSKETGWSIGSGVATRSNTGSVTSILQTISLTAAKVYRLKYTVASILSGDIRPRILTTTATTVDGAAQTVAGIYLAKLTAPASPNRLGFRGAATFAGSLDDAIMFEETPTCAPQGVWDYYAVPFNGSDVAGPPSGPVVVTVI
jgi:hypothetical protein